MEFWDVYDKYRNKTGKIVSKDQKNFKEDEYGLAVHIAIFNSKNEMLIQKRQSTKDKYPNLWDVSAGGHAIYGETSEEAIERELFEELGIDFDFSDQRAYFTVNFNDEFGDFYILKNFDLEINDLKVQHDEVQNATWASKDEVLQLIEEEKFIPYIPSFIDLLFSQKDGRGVIR